MCWLAIRPGKRQRERFVSWQSILTAAFKRGLLEPLADDYPSHQLAAERDAVQVLA